MIFIALRLALVSIATKISPDTSRLQEKTIFT